MPTGKQIGSNNGASIVCSWNTRGIKPGIYPISVVAEDAAGNKNQMNITVTVVR